MKRMFKYITGIVLILLILYGIIFDLKKIKNSVDKNSVSYNGWLKVKDNNILNHNNDTFQLIGLSTHGIQWFNELYTYDNMKKIKEEYNINTYRVSLYVDSKSNGYSINDELYSKLINIVENAIKLDMYVIIDWHIMNENPNNYIELSKDFFENISKKYKNTPNIIYEICNEASLDISWNELRDYSEQIIKIIRNNSKKSIILVGTPKLSKSIKDVVNNQLNYENIMYTLHYYAGSDDEVLNELKKYENYKLPIFISECGITNSTGDGKLYEEKFRLWINYLNKNNISWVFWSFSDKDESSSIVDKNFDLTKTGSILKDIIIP